VFCAAQLAIGEGFASVPNGGSRCSLEHGALSWQRRLRHISLRLADRRETGSLAAHLGSHLSVGWFPP
jgi:hypothetical protein